MTLWRNASLRWSRENWELVLLEMCILAVTSIGSTYGKHEYEIIRMNPFTHTRWWFLKGWRALQRWSVSLNVRVIKAAELSALPLYCPMRPEAEGQTWVRVYYECKRCTNTLLLAWVRGLYFGRYRCAIIDTCKVIIIWFILIYLCCF